MELFHGLVESFRLWMVGHPVHAGIGFFGLGTLFGFWLRARVARKPKKE